MFPTEAQLVFAPQKACLQVTQTGRGVAAHMASTPALVSQVQSTLGMGPGALQAATVLLAGAQREFQASQPFICGRGCSRCARGCRGHGIAGVGLGNGQLL